MARQKSEFVSGLGTGFEIVKALSDEVNSLGGNDDNLRQIISNRTLRKELANLIVGNNAKIYQISVTGDISENVRFGNYDWSNSDINDRNFQADERHQCEIIFKHFDKSMSTDAVLKALDAEGLRPATMSELLALGIEYPELQRQFPIVALGSVWQSLSGHRYVGYLNGLVSGRGLFLSWVGSGWLGYCRFAAVRK
ncbi:hypothetical protein H6761_02825 [Candidatus Nomurabacteria bacterium]|nr:hypothetical protein [Candidatus Nomurabacteria bacterium]